MRGPALSLSFACPHFVATHTASWFTRHTIGRVVPCEDLVEHGSARFSFMGSQLSVASENIVVGVSV